MLITQFKTVIISIIFQDTEDKDIQNSSFACYFILVWNMVSCFKGTT